MGAVANLAPDLFAGILAQVPFVDPLTTILDPSLPLTVTEWDEWGNPLSDSDVYSYMKSYSPYENVEAKQYPAILAMTSLNDTRVYYVEPAKWVAALRHANANGNPILLKTQMNAGHGGVSGRYKAWQETAFQYAWLLAAADGDRNRRRPERRPRWRSAAVAASSSTWADWDPARRRRWPGTWPHQHQAHGRATRVREATGPRWLPRQQAAGMM